MGRSDLGVFRAADRGPIDKGQAQAYGRRVNRGMSAPRAHPISQLPPRRPSVTFPAYLAT